MGVTPLTMPAAAHTGFDSDAQDDVLERVFGFSPARHAKKMLDDEKKYAMQMQADMKNIGLLSKNWAESNHSSSNGDNFDQDLESMRNDIEKDIQQGWEKSFPIAHEHKRELFTVDHKLGQKLLQDQRDEAESKYERTQALGAEQNFAQDQWARSATCQLEEQLYGFSPTLTRKIAETRALTDEAPEHLEGAIPTLHYYPDMHYHQHKHFSSHHSPHGQLRSARPDPAWHQQASRFEGPQYGTAMANQINVAHYDVSERPVVRYQQMNADKAYKSYELLGDYQLSRQNAIKQEIKEIKHDIEACKHATDTEMYGGGSLASTLKLQRKYEVDLERLENMLKQKCMYDADADVSQQKSSAGQKKSYTLQHDREKYHKLHGAEHTRGLKELERFCSGRQEDGKLAKARKMEGIDSVTMGHMLRLGIGISGRQSHNAGHGM